jgi:hypothetical protein
MAPHDLATTQRRADITGNGAGAAGAVQGSPVHLLLLVVVVLLVAWAVEAVGMTVALAVVVLRARRAGAPEDAGDGPRPGGATAHPQPDATTEGVNAPPQTDGWPGEGS